MLYFYLDDEENLQNLRHPVNRSLPFHRRIPGFLHIIYCNLGLKAIWFDHGASIIKSRREYVLKK